MPTKVLKVHRVIDGERACHIGFLPKRYLPDAAELNGKKAQVIRNLKDSENRSERAKAHRNKGMILAAICWYVWFLFNLCVYVGGVFNI